MLMSLADAVNFSRSSATVFSYIHFLFAAIFIVFSLQSIETRNKIQTGIFLIVCFWCVDALIQFSTGRNIFGYPYIPPQLTGMFYPKVRLGHIIAVLSPFVFEYIRQRFNAKPWLVLIIIPVCIVVLLSGKRVAWLMFILAIVFYLIFLWITTKKISLKTTLLTTILCIGTVFSLYTFHQPFQNRLDQSLGIFSSNYEKADIASARRLDLWKTSLIIFQENWANGIGPRGFRNAYSNYADKNNFWMQNGREGQTHPHQFLMEIAAETGLIGIIGYLCFCIILLITIRREHNLGNTYHTTWSLCLIIAIFPLNAHLAFYGSYWSSVMWFMFSITAAWIIPTDSPGER
jgi:O-antigen ligase